jgi:hypothetical protein
MRIRPPRVLASIVVALAILAATALAQDAVITGTDGNDVLNGTPAGESIYGGAGNDVINAGAGDDDLDGGPGADVLNGGDGSDSVAYDGSAGVDVTFDGAANDGASGEGDNVGADVEDVFGGDGPDKLTGDGAANTIDGGAGDDHISGGKGEDVLLGGDGDDLIDSRDGVRDRVECGAGADTATIDRIDVVSSDCERRGKPPVTITPGLTLLTRKRQLVISSITARSAVTVACVRHCHPASPPTRAILRRASVTLDAGRTARLPLPARIAGATIELGVTARGAETKCVRYRIGRRFGSVTPLKGVRCTTVARSERLRPA